MASRTQPLSTDFLEEEITVRGSTYHLRELSIGDYDELVKKATTTKPNPVTGEDSEVVDNAVLLKLMVTKCSFDPKLTLESLSTLPMRVVLKLNSTVNKMHYGDEPETQKPEAETPEEGPAKGND